MRIVHINTFPHKATGMIMMEIHRQLTELGEESYVVWGRGREPENQHEISIRDNLGTGIHGLYTRVADRTGFASWNATGKLLRHLEEIQPDCIHLHNLHGYYINIQMLFTYIREKRKKVFWTFHDCWPFTGHCAYFDRVQCQRWQTGCHDCIQLNTYPASKFLDASAWNWKKKKQLFTKQDIEIIVPSEWLSGMVQKSFMGDYPVHVIHNGIDKQVFRPTPSLFRETYGLARKYIILGAAGEWTERKGLADFFRLADELKGKCDYKIVLAGLNKHQREQVPDEFLKFPKIETREELAELYSAADVFFNPTYEDNFPTTNLESIACGTPVITYQTGGSPECVRYPENGYVLPKGDVKYAAEIMIKNEKKRKVGQRLEHEFTKEGMMKRYMNLYQQ